MDLDLKALKIEKENSIVEAKSAQFALPKSIWETYSAFANTNGGQIILGISEDKETKELHVTGIDDPEKVKIEFWNTINNPQKVSTNILTENDFSEIKLENGKVIFIIHVPKARLELCPIYINDDILKGSFKRNHEGDYHLTKEEVSKILRDASPSSYDLKVFESLPLSALSNETITKYRRYHVAYRNNHPWSNLPTEQYLLMIGAAGYSDTDDLAHPTMAGLLMFGEEHTITQFFPDYFLDYRENLDPERVKWTDRIQSISGEWTGNIFDFFLLVSNKIVRDFKVPFKLDGMVRIDNTLLHDATREAFINCLSNADYFGRCGIVIRKNVDSIVYENPGSIRVGKEQMFKGGVSDARNKTIMKMFNLLGYGEKAGSGIPLIIQATKEFGLPMPQVEENVELDRTLFSIFLTPVSEQKTAVNTARATENNNSADFNNNSAETDNISAETNNNSAETSNNSAETSNNSAEFVNSLLSSRLTNYREESKKLICSIYSKALYAGSVTTNEMASEFKLSTRRTREILQEMVNLGLLEETGKTKRKQYSPVAITNK